MPASSAGTGAGAWRPPPTPCWAPTASTRPCGRCSTRTRGPRCGTASCSGAGRRPGPPTPTGGRWSSPAGTRPSSSSTIAAGAARPAGPTPGPGDPAAQYAGPTPGPGDPAAQYAGPSSRPRRPPRPAGAARHQLGHHGPAWATGRRARRAGRTGAAARAPGGGPALRPGRVPAGLRRCGGPGRGDRGLLRVPLLRPRPAPPLVLGRVSLLGDAAHPMYRTGSNGASQAILDARALARHRPPSRRGLRRR